MYQRVKHSFAGKGSKETFGIRSAKPTSVGRLVLVAASNYGVRSGEGQGCESLAGSDIFPAIVVPCEHCVA